MSQPSNLFAQMRQRNVFRIGTMYIVGAWLLLQFGEVMIEIMELPMWIGRALVVLLALGFPFVLILAWVFDHATQEANTDHNDPSGTDLRIKASRRIDTAIIVVLALALGTTFLFYDSADREPVSGPLTTELSTLQSEALSSPNSAQISPPKESDYLLIGNLVDFTGATGKGSQAWGQAIIDASNWINEHGGVAGKLFDLDTIETSYLVRRALPAYEKWLTQDVVAIQGYGTNIGMALKDKVAQNQIPYFSSAYAASFSAPEGNPGIAAPAPYNFFYGPTYSDGCRGLVEWAKKDWQRQGRSDKPTYVHMGDSHPYPNSPKAACESYAQELGFDVAAPIIFSLIPDDFTPQCRRLKELDIEYAFLANLDKSVASILTQCAQLSVSTQFMANIWGFDENVMREAGQAAHDVVWVMGATHWNSSAPGMYTVRQISGMSDPEQSKYRSVHYIRGVCSMFFLKEAIEVAAQQGPITGTAIKSAMYQKSDWVPAGLEGVCRPATWSASDHRGVTEVLVYRASVRGETRDQTVDELFASGQISMAHAFTANIPRRPEWLGY